MEIRKKILVYNSDFGGHYAEYINHLIRFVGNSDLDVVFYLHQKLKGNIIPAENVKWIREEVRRSSHYLRPYMKGVAELHILESIVANEKITHVLLMNIDSFVVTLGAVRYKKLKVRTRGIYFAPNFFRNKDGLFIKEWIKFAIQYFNLFKLDKNVERVFVLNDKWLTVSLNKLKGIRPMFHYLQEPINSEINLTSGFSIHKDLEVEKRKYNFLIFGCINFRKNIENILEALLRLDPETKLMCNLLIVGEPMEGYGDYIKPIIENIIKKEKELDIYCSFSFFEENFKDTIFHEIDFVLLPYLNFYSSSGVLGWAAKHDKLVIAPNMGLMSDLVTEYKLGLCVDVKSVDSIFRGILELIRHREEIEKNANFEGYKKECRIDGFCTSLFSGLY